MHFLKQIFTLNVHMGRKLKTYINALCEIQTKLFTIGQKYIPLILTPQVIAP